MILLLGVVSEVFQNITSTDNNNNYTTNTTTDDFDERTIFFVPFIAGFIGYITNVVALWMTFYPIEYVGIKLFRFKNEPWGIFGWQGIIPTKVEKMAITTFDLFTKKIFNVKEVFDRIDPIQFSEVMSDPILLLMDKVITNVANRHMPSTWHSLPQDVKDDIIITAEQEGHSFLSEFIKDMQEHIDDVLDVKSMSVTKCVENKELVINIFQECGAQEFTFIRTSGFYFGFLFGIGQALLMYFFYELIWIAPVAGFIVGWFTNYVALKVIFSPLEPKECFCGLVSIQGLFIKRQREVSAVYSRVLMTDMLHVKALWDEIIYGKLHTNFFAMLRAHTIAFTDKLLIEIKPLAIAAMGLQQFNQMKEDIAQGVIQELPSIIDHSYQYTQDALDMENMIRDRMQALTPAEFEGVLHPAFEEDEIQLIILGGVLGMIVGVGQMYIVHFDHYAIFTGAIGAVFLTMYIYYYWKR